MAIKKYLSLDKLTEYDALIKETIDDSSEAALTSAKEYANTELAKKQDVLTFDSTPTEGSNNPVTSDGVKKYVDERAVQSDWNENDSESAAYIKNRTHYSNGTTITENIVICLEETTIETTYQYGDSGLFEFKPSLGTKYIVTFDDVEYECDSFLNDSIFIEVSNDIAPFSIVYNEFDKKNTITTTELGTHTISIISKETITKENIQKLNKKYLDMSWDELDNKPFGDEERENLFVLLQEYNIEDNSSNDYLEVRASIRNLNRYAKYDFVIRGDVYKNVAPSGVYSSYYQWISWGTCPVENFAYYNIGDYPFILNAQFSNEFDENGDITTATGVPLYGGLIIVDGNKYPNLDPNTEIQIYRSGTDVNCIDYRYMPEGYPKAKSETKIIYNQNFTISEDDPFVFEVGIPDLVRGQAYTVILDNVEYKCIAVDDGYGGEVLGNFYVVGEGEDTGEPFFIFEEYNDDPYACGIAVNTAGDHTVIIKTSVEEIVTIDPKFIQDAYYTDSKYVSTYNYTKIRNANNYGYLPFDNFALVDGVEYTVKIDDVQYKCKAYTINGVVMLGNGAIKDYSHPNSANIPLLILPNPDHSNEGQIWVADELFDEYHHYSIYGTIETVHKINPKYMPEFPVTAGEGENSTVQGESTTASGDYSHAEGYRTTASGNFSHAEGRSTTASGYFSHAEGDSTTASGYYSHAEGDSTTASGTYSHAEGYYSKASGTYSHAEGNYSTASGNYSHAEGDSTTASGNYTHAEGNRTTANSKSQHVQGEYNVLDTEGSKTERGKYAHIVGNGTGSSDRSNAHTLEWNGTAWFQGDVYVGSTSGTNRDDGSKKLATTDDIDALEATEDEMLDILIETDMLMAVSDADGAILTDENGNIILW